MPLTNAERQRRWRAKRNALASEAWRVRNWRVDRIVQDRIKREKLMQRERRLAVQLLLKTADPEEDAELLSWVRTWRK